MELLKCILYIAAIGIVSNIIGTALPRKWFDPDKFPYRPYAWERDGQVYRKIGIQLWKDKLPDMSKVVHNMYRKEVDPRPNADNMRRLVQETCVAEFVHKVLMLLSLLVVKIWKGKWGWYVWFACVFGNLPFVLIQRYNRPRLRKALDRLTAKQAQRAIL